jgi:hypothetical protein
MDDRSEKNSGFGIGEVGNIPASTILDEIQACEIIQKQEKSWSEHCFQRATCCDLEGNHICGQPISRRVYFSGTAGSHVMCEKHWLQYNSRLGATFDEVMAAIQTRIIRERARVKKCYVCGNHNAVWNSSAGRDL